MTFESLHQIIGEDDGGRDFGKDVGVDLYLRVQVAGQIGEIDKGLVQFFRQQSQAGVRVGQGSVGGRQRLLQLLLEVRHYRPRLGNQMVRVGDQFRAVGEHPAQLIGQAKSPVMTVGRFVSLRHQ